MLNHFSAWLTNTPLTVFLENAAWAVPLIQTLHILMIAVVFGGAAFINLRILGLLDTEQPLPNVFSRFLPPLTVGVVVLAVTGVLLIASEPNRAIFRVVFWVKMGLVVAALLATWGQRRWVAAGLAGAAKPSALAYRLLAVVSVGLWVSVIFAGRWIGYVSGWPGSPT